MELTVAQYKTLKSLERALNECIKANLGIKINDGKIEYEEAEKDLSFSSYTTAES